MWRRQQGEHHLPTKNGKDTDMKRLFKMNVWCRIGALYLGAMLMGNFV